MKQVRHLQNQTEPEFISMTATPLTKMNKAPLLKAAQNLETRVERLEGTVQFFFIVSAISISAAFIF